MRRAGPPSRISETYSSSNGKETLRRNGNTCGICRDAYARALLAALDNLHFSPRGYELRALPVNSDRCRLAASRDRGRAAREGS